MTQCLGNQVTMTEGRWAGKGLGVHVALLQTRGDWAFYKEVLGYPSWAARKCCWRYEATNAPGLNCELRDATMNAAWMAHIYKRHVFVFLQRASCISPSTLFQSPGASRHMVMIWLHTVDQRMLPHIIGDSNNYACGITWHCLHLGSWAWAQEAELLLESTFCARHQFQWHCEGHRREVLGCI